MPLGIPTEDYDSSSESDTRTRSRQSFSAPSRSSFPFLFSSGYSSTSSTATSTPLPSRSTSPLPQFYPPSCASDTDSDPAPLLRTNRGPGWRDARHGWWSTSRRRRKRNGRIIRFLKKWTRRIVRHPFFPSQPITIVLTLILLSLFAIFLTLLLIHILNPDKEPLPWRAYCSAPSLSLPYDSLPSTSTPIFPHGDAMSVPPFPPPDLDSLPPAGVFVGVFSIDSGFERRMLVRTTWANHARSREGAGEGDGGVGTSRTVVRFMLGQPRKDWERRIKLEMEMYNDIVILPMVENMNSGKTHTFFSWASINAWVPPVYTNHTSRPPSFSYSNYTASPPSLAPHDSSFAWQDHLDGKTSSWVRPDYVVKVDDDSFVMLAELEARLRVELHAKPFPRNKPTTRPSHARGEPLPSNRTSDNIALVPQPAPHISIPLTQVNDPLIYWGYLVTNRLHKFMAGELYALSWSLVEWVAKDPAVKGVTRGAEDKQTAKWMKMHPRASEVRWSSERCWIYDHPRSGTVYAHGFLYPSEAIRVKRSMLASQDKTHPHVMNSPVTPSPVPTPPTPFAWAYSTVSTFGVRYSPPLPDLSPPHSVEALVEGSDMSMIREGSPMTTDYAWTHREGRKKRYQGKRVGGTVVVHFIKKNMWFLETAFALLEGEEYSEAEKFQSRESRKASHTTTLSNPTPTPTRTSPYDTHTKPRPDARHGP